MNFLGFGNGSDGDLNISTSVTDSPIDSSCSGTSGTNSLSATNASFSAGQFILIIQSRGTGAGLYEVNKISGYSTGTITTVHPLVNTYTDSGASQAQVIVLKQYGNVNITGTLTSKAWDGDVGGIIAFMANGKVYGNGTITALGKGFRGGAGVGPGTGVDGYQGESTLGAGVKSYLANGISGGGGDYLVNQASYGGGGGHATAGQTGPNDNNGAEGVGGETIGEADLDTIFFGGAGGSASTGNDGSSTSTAGGNGGGIIMIFSRLVTGVTINANGSAGGNAGLQSKPSGGGAGGSILIKSVTSTLGTITASGGAGGDGAAIAGGDGRIRIESCSISGTTTPTASTQGGQSYCSSLTFIQ